MAINRKFPINSLIIQTTVTFARARAQPAAAHFSAARVIGWVFIHTQEERKRQVTTFTTRQSRPLFIRKVRENAGNN